MSRTTTRWLIFPAVALMLILVGLQVLTPPAYSNLADPASAGLLWAYLVILPLCLILLLLALVGALVKLGQLRRYAWFWTLLGSVALIAVGIGIVITPIVLLVYSAVGPITPADSVA